jgi:hypothetical protein
VVFCLKIPASVSVYRTKMVADWGSTFYEGELFQLKADSTELHSHVQQLL